jgi:D-amino-acid dehydrogenase
MSSPDVIVVGAGAIGAATAYELARRGARVTLLERSHVAAGCSYGNAGLISPSHTEALANPAALRDGIAWLARRDSPFHLRPRLSLLPWLARFGAASLPGRSAAATARLRALTSVSLEAHEALARAGLPTSFARRGILSVYESEPAFAAARARAHNNGGETRVLAPEAARALEPALGPDIAGAIFHPREAHCDPGDFTAALVEGARTLGAEIHTGVETLSLRRSNGRVVELQTSAGALRPGAIVLAAGAWTKALAAQVGVHVPLEGGKGYHLEMAADGPRQPQLPMFLEEARVTATPLAGRLRLTGTLELSGLDLRIDPIRLEAIGRAARRVLRLSPQERPARIWRGLRPCAPDGLPIVGQADGIANLYLATGHAMLGIALAPVTGEIVADLVTGAAQRHEIEGFAPARFRRVRQAMTNHVRTGGRS